MFDWIDFSQFIYLLEYVKQLEGVYKDFTEFTRANPVVGGMMGMWVLGVITYVFRSIPAKIFNVLDRYLTVTVSLNNANESFYHLLKWYETNKNVKYSRTLRVTNGRYGYDKSETSVGFGKHYFLHGLWPFKLNRYIQSSDGGEKIKEELTIKTIGFTQQRLINLINLTTPKKVVRSDVYVYTTDGWERNKTLPKRSWDSVILKEGQKDTILNFVQEFESSKEWYNEMGISYKTGILLSGPPGTGKSSVIKALASHLEKNLCVLECGSLSDTTFSKALSNTPKNSIVLMEDFDSVKSTKDREAIVKETYDYSTLTLSGMLNAIDGVFSSDGRILIATTNHIENLDAALLRPGRFDLKEVIGYANTEMVVRMFNKFYPDFVVDNIIVQNEVSLAQVENCFLMNKSNPEQAKVEVEKLKKDTNAKRRKIATFNDSEDTNLIPKNVRELIEGEL